MAASEYTSTELRAQLAAARCQAGADFRLLENQLNVTRRVRNNMRLHAGQWIAISVVVGAVAAKAIPMLFRRSRPSLSRSLLPIALRALATSALPLIAAYIAQSQAAAAPGDSTL